jgi:hypothetical protein
MNVCDFFNEHFGRHLVEQHGTPQQATQRCLSASHRLAKGTASRLTGWAVIRPGDSRFQAKLAVNVEGMRVCEQTRYQAWMHALDTWDGTPMLLLEFDKTITPAGNLFLTADLRAVRICGPKSVETFNWIEPPAESAGKHQRKLWKDKLNREKRAKINAA